MSNINTLEKNKFTTDVNGEVCVRVCGDFSSGDPILTSILSAPDRVLLITYEDFGTPQQRIISLEYTANSVPGFKYVKNIAYTQIGARYRRDTITGSIVNV